MLKIFAVVAGLLAVAAPALARPVTLLALGDSLTSGYGLGPDQAFPVQLQKALAGSYPDLTIINAGVAGDTAADGLARVDWALSDEVNGVIVELGANDALRGLAPAQAEQALDAILARVSAKGLPILLVGMRAPPNLGADYAARFDSMYDRLAKKYGTLLYPFYLEGVAADRSLNQADGLHPNPQGVQVIVSRIAPEVERLIKQVKEKAP
jgi:acyl-CoA thioesterase-1